MRLDTKEGYLTSSGAVGCRCIASKEPGTSRSGAGRGETMREQPPPTSHAITSLLPNCGLLLRSTIFSIPHISHNLKDHVNSRKRYPSTLCDTKPMRCSEVRVLTSSQSSTCKSCGYLRFRSKSRQSVAQGGGLSSIHIWGSRPIAAPAIRIPASTPKRRLANGGLAVGGKAGLPNEARLPTKGQA